MQQRPLVKPCPRSKGKYIPTSQRKSFHTLKFKTYELFLNWYKEATIKLRIFFSKSFQLRGEWFFTIRHEW